MIGVAAIGLIVILVVLANRPETAPTEAEIEQAEQVRERSTLLDLDEAVPELREPAARPERRPPGQPLNQLVPGFRDLLIVTHLDDRGEAFYQVLWGPGASAAARSSAFDDAVFDQSGNYFARFAASRWNTTALSLGDLSSESSEIVAIDVDGFSWHDAEPARLAYTMELETGRRGLFTAQVVRPTSRAELVITYVQDIGAARLMAWGDYGFVFESDGETLVIGPNGADLGRAPVTYLGRDADGSLLVSDAGAVLRASPDLLQLTEPPWTSQLPAATVTLAVRSPYRPMSALAVQEAAGMAVYVVTETDLVGLSFGTEVRLHGWASDGQFLVMSRDEGRKSVLLFYDVDADQVFELEMTDRVDSVFSRPS